MLTEYRYNVYLTYEYNNKVVEIDNTNIKSIVIDYDYDGKNMPTIFLTANIDKNILDDMITNISTKILHLRITKFINNGSSFIIEENYIDDDFIYFVSNDLNYDEKLDYSQDTTDSTDIYKKVMLALLKQKLIDNNKIVNNNVIKNTYLIDIILYYTKHMNLLIEPVNNVFVENLIIPPLDSITKLIKFINDNYSIYKNEYRLFYDFNLTYLLSSSGESIQNKNEEASVIVIKVNDTLSNDSKLQGIDMQDGSYIINIATDDIHYYKDTATQRVIDGIMVIDSEGDYEKSIEGKKYKILRTNLDNLDQVLVEQSRIDNNSFSITVLKTEIDSSIITMNKMYIIRNYDKLQYQDGLFLLARKREVYTPDSNNFVLSTMMTFKKTIS